MGEHKMIKGVVNQLTLVYWINLICLFLIGLYLLFTVGITGKSETESDFICERFGIIFTLILIPLALKFYHKRHKKIIEYDCDKYLNNLKKMFYLRMLIIDFTIIFNLICFYNIESVNFLYLVLIGLFAFFACYPSVDKVEIN